MKRIASITLGIIFLTACSTSNEVSSNRLFQKRKYQKGWHINSSKKIDKSSKGEKHEEIAINSDIVKTKSKVVDSKTLKKDESTQVTNQSISINSETVVTNTESNGEDKLIKPNKEVKNVENAESKSSSNSIVQIQEENNSLESNEAENIISIESSSDSSSGGSDVGIVLLVILAILLPPLAVFLARGVGTEFWISVLLTIFFWVPGIIYALLLNLVVI